MAFYKTKILLFIFLLLLISNFSLQGKPSLYYFNHLTTSSGLPNNAVRAILKDSAGFMWFGTKTGLCRFDGYEMKTYPVLTGSDIWSLEELNDNKILIGTHSLLYICDREKDEFSPVVIASAPHIIKAIKKISNDKFLLGTEHGLYIVSETGDTERLVLDGDISSSNHVTAIIKESDEIFWFSTANGLGKYSITDQTISFYKMSLGRNSSNHYTCLSMIGSSIYLGSLNNGVFKFDTKDFTFDQIDNLKDYPIASMDSNGAILYVGTGDSGVIIFSTETNTILNTINHNKEQPNSINSNTISALNIDNETLWIGTFFGGISYSSSSMINFSFYNNTGFHTTDYNVRSFYPLPDGNKLIGTRSGLLFISEKNKNTYKFTKTNSPLRSETIMHINGYGGKILLGTYGGGLYFFDTEKLLFSDFLNKEPFLHGSFFCSCRDSAGNLWIGSNEGLYQCSIDAEIINKYDTNNSILSDNTILSLFVDSFNRVWIGTHAGLCMIEVETSILRANLFTDEYNNILNFVNYILEDSDNNIWFCSNRGLLKVNSSLTEQQYYSEVNLLPENVVKSGIEKNDRYVRFATSRKLLEYDKNAGIFYTYKNPDGLITTDFNNSVAKMPDGTIAWANEGGLLYTIDTEENNNFLKSKKPSIIAYYFGDVEYDLINRKRPKSIKLPNQQNNIKFKFSCFNYSSPYEDIFDYILEGYDIDWQKIIGKNEVTYSNLPAGKYIFKLKIPNIPDFEEVLQIEVSHSYSAIVWTTTIFVICFSLFFTRLYIKKLKYSEAKDKLKNKVEKYKTNRLTDEECKVLLFKLSNYMNEEKPYIDYNLKIGDLAKSMGTSSHSLSYLFNQYLDQSYSTYVNEYRIAEFKRLVNNSDYSNYTISALAELCGFNSRASFFRIFKQFTGITPNEYIRSIGGHNK